MSKTYSVEAYLNIIEKCENHSFHSYAKERTRKALWSRANPRQYHYFTYVEDILKNYDTEDDITIQANGNYGIRRNGAEVGYGRINLHLINNPCYPKYTKIF